MLMACGSSVSNVAENQNSNSNPNPNPGEQVMQNADTPKLDPSSIKTLGDVFKYDGEGMFQTSYNEEAYAVAFEVNGVYYRARAKMEKSIYDEIQSLDIEDYEERQKKERELLSPIEVTQFENLSDMMPSKEELDKYVGMTGQDLFDNGWDYYYYNLEDMEAGLNHGNFGYKVKFDYDGPRMENTDDFDFYEKFKDLKIKSVEVEGLGSGATDIG